MSNGATVDWEEVAKLGDALSDPAFRRAFKKNADKAIKDKGLDKKKIDPTVYKTLKGLSTLQLGKLVDVRSSLKGAQAKAFVFPRMV